MRAVSPTLRAPTPPAGSKTPPQSRVVTSPTRASTPEKLQQRTTCEYVKEQSAASSLDRIRVAVRMRPMNDKERSRGDVAVYGTDGRGNVGPLNPADGGISAKYCYDNVFTGTSTNSEVFSTVVQPCVMPVLDGVNATIFA
jgi:hypothetical protein